MGSIIKGEGIALLIKTLFTLPTIPRSGFRSWKTNNCYLNQKYVFLFGKSMNFDDITSVIIIYNYGGKR